VNILYSRIDLYEAWNGPQSIVTLQHYVWMESSRLEYWDRILLGCQPHVNFKFYKVNYKVVL